MKAIFFALALLGTTLSVSAQADSLSFWTTDFAVAQDSAEAAQKNIVLVFQGSDWCAPCIKLDKEVWSMPEFAELATAEFVFVKADFPRRRANRLSDEQQAANAALAERYNTIGSFPLVVVINPAGDVLGQMGYEKIGPTAYYEKLKSLATWEQK